MLAQNADLSLGIALRIVDDAWEELRRSVFVQRQLGIAPVRFPDLSFAEAERRTQVGRALLARVATVDPSRLPHEVALSLRLVRARAQTWAREADWYWVVADPLGFGFFSMFFPTAYCGGFLINTMNDQLAAFSFAELGDCDRYLALIDDYARVIDQMMERTAGQAERGMRLPQVQIHQARTMLAAFSAGLRANVAVALPRLGSLSATGFLRELENRVTTRLEPAFVRALAGFSDEYLAAAPTAVGLGQFARGREVYADLVKLHTTLDLTPEEVHGLGLERMAKIEADMQAIRGELGFSGAAADFLAALNADGRWRADTADGVQAVFERYIERLKPRLNDLFSSMPQAPYGVAALPSALQSSMTFGYYDGARPDRTHARYLFNSGNLTRQALLNVAAVTYHELMPGHHMHLATQLENPALHPFRSFSFVNAYNEGWAEYAATLAGEIGMYEEPEERYGRLIMDAFLTCRLVVDTGMNALGWTLEQARDYLREHSGMAETEIQTETLRYSCDIPAQSLAYKLGDTYMLSLRDRMRAALGERFSLKAFHAAILGSGGMPLPDLEWHVEYEIARLQAAA